MDLMIEHGLPHSTQPGTTAGVGAVWKPAATGQKLASITNAGRRISWGIKRSFEKPPGVNNPRGYDEALLAFDE